MATDDEELDQIADAYHDYRIIRSSLYCGRCGYNLRSLPHIYTCPECGNRYNARPLKMEGIFLPHSAPFPLGETIAFALCSLVVWVLLPQGLATGDGTRLCSGWLFAAMGVYLAVQGYRRLMRFLRFREIYKRVARQEEEQQ